MFFLSNFNRRINIKKFIRIVKGKEIPVKAHTRKNTALRIKTALDDLYMKNSRSEGAYMFDKRTGKVSRYIPGEENSVRSRSLLKKYPPNQNIWKNKGILHNHPNRTSFSSQDILINQGIHEFIIDSNKNIYSIKRIIPDNDFVESIYNFQIRESEKLLYKFKEDFDITTNKDNWFLLTHYKNNYLHDKGLVRYRARFFNPVDNSLVYNNIELKDKLYDYLDHGLGTRKKPFIKNKKTDTFKKPKEIKSIYY
jgi:hypothetical protein